MDDLVGSADCEAAPDDEGAGSISVLPIWELRKLVLG